MLGLDAKNKEGSASVAQEVKKTRKDIDDIKNSIEFIKRCVYECFVLLKRKGPGENNEK